MTRHESAASIKPYNHVYKFSGALALEHTPAVAGDTHPHPHGLPFVSQQAEALTPAEPVVEQFDFHPDDN